MLGVYVKYVQLTSTLLPQGVHVASRSRHQLAPRSRTAPPLAVVAGEERGVALATAKAFRQLVGLGTDDAWIATISSGPTDDRYGIPLSLEEAAELDRRGAIALALDRLSFLQGRTWYVGLYMDQPAGGQVVITVSGVPDIDVAQLAALLPAGSDVRFKTVDFSAAQLDSLRNELHVWLDRPGSYEEGFRALWVDPVEGRVHLSLESGSSAPLEVLGDLATRPQLVIDYERGAALTACSSRLDCASPLKGGLDIYNNFPQGKHCTLGYRGRPTSGTPLYQYALVAGHCFQGYPWYHASQQFASENSSYFYSGSYVDFGVIQIANSTPLGTSPANLVYNASSTVFQQITGVLSEANMAVGTTVCKAGTTTGYSCGVVESTNQDRTWGAMTLHHQWVMWGQSVDGDSGGPVGNGSYAGGIISYSFDSGHGWHTGFGTMAQVIARGWRPCYASTC